MTIKMDPDDLYLYFEGIVYGQNGVRRFTQDSPIMPDVLIAFGTSPGNQRIPLLLTPHHGASAGDLAAALRNQFHCADWRSCDGIPRDSRIAYNQTVVAADLTFRELVCLALPLTRWWSDYLAPKFGVVPRSDGKAGTRRKKNPTKRTARPEKERTSLFDQLLTEDHLNQLREQLLKALAEKNYAPAHCHQLSSDIVWLARVIGTVAVFHDQPELLHDVEEPRDPDVARVVDNAIDYLLMGVLPENDQTPPLLFSVNRNRSSVEAVYDSVGAIKADATRRVFDVSGKGVTWAVLDSGIDATHFAFRKRDLNRKPCSERAFEGARNNTRVRETYNFADIRDWLMIESGDELPDTVAEAIGHNEDRRTRFEELRRNLIKGRVVEWDVLRKLIQIPHVEGEYTAPTNAHGTHVAGIIGAEWRGDDTEEMDSLEFDPELRQGGALVGVAPDIQFVDIRVMKESGGGDEFAMIAGMQFVRYMNENRDIGTIHGANLSFSLRHDFTVYACGQTPVCEEAARMVGSGIVVVAAAGNEGMAQYKLRNKRVSTGYRNISITDPGNGAEVITVGATHRRDPHTYGVSYFSSRGPTGDGRRKPDLVAPGEKITSTVPQNRFCQMDGTSQAAPHVSGAIALLMERCPELFGKPEMIKRILCKTATDLGREPYFQGAGMVDILRALQSV